MSADAPEARASDAAVPRRASDDYLDAVEEQRRWLRGAFQKNSSEKDTTVVALAGGALALSIAFLSNLRPKPEWIWVLVLAWIMFGLSVSLVLASYVTNARQIKRAVDRIDDWKKQPIGVPPDGDYMIGRFRVNDVLDTGAVVFLISGLAFVVVFAARNVT